MACIGKGYGIAEAGVLYFDGYEAMLDAWGQRSVMMIQCSSDKADSHCSHYRSPPAQSRRKCMVAPSNSGAPRRVLPHPSNHVWAQHCQGFTLGSSNTPGDICNALVHPLHVPHLSQPYSEPYPAARS